MSDCINLGIILLTALIHASLQLDLGGLILLYHSSLGKHVPKKTRMLASNFILGAGFMILLGLLSAAFIVLGFFGGNLGITEFSISIGILVSLAIVVLTILIMDRKRFKEVDYALLATFCVFFIF